MAVLLQFNEGRACDAIVRLLEKREGAVRQHLRWPERERHAAPVDLVCNIGAKLFAIEHTGIEPFAGHMQLEAEAETHFQPIEAMVDMSSGEGGTGRGGRTNEASSARCFSRRLNPPERSASGMPGNASFRDF